MAYYHGVKTKEQTTSIATPVVADCGIPFVIGTAPVQAAGGKVNEPVLCYSFAEAVAALGYSDDWKKYTLCEFMYSQFKLYGASPVVFLNVLDPEVMKTAVAAADKSLIDGQIKLPIDAVSGTVVVKATSGTGSAYEPDQDYTLFYSGEKLVIEVLEDGSIPSGVSTLNVSYSAINRSAVMESTIVGGYDITTQKTTGLECIDQVMPKYGIIPDLILAPGFSHYSTVAAAMATKAAGINGLFSAKAMIDADTGATDGADHYSKVPEWKNSKNIYDENQVLCWPLFKLGDYTFHASTQIAGLMAKVDTDNDGCPYESPSNKSLKIDSMVNAAGDEILLELSAANYLNSNGIVTALNFIGGFKCWGNETACYPSNTDLKDYFISINRMFSWVASTLIQTYWNKVDKPANKRLINCIVDSANIWLNGLTSEEKLLGGRIEFREDENPTTALLSGIIGFHVYMTPPVPAKEIEFTLEFDVDYLNELFA